MKHVRIICTIGPSCESIHTLRKMAQAGMEIARLNFSHGTYPQHAKYIRNIRALNKEGFHIKILQDLEGYRIRIGRFGHGQKAVALKKNQAVTLTQSFFSRRGGLHIPFDYEGPLSAIRAGYHIFIDDGNIEFIVEKSGKDLLHCRAITDSILKERKGINIPRFRPAFQGLTEKDEKDLAFGLSHNVDFIAQSFVRSAADILDLKKNIGRSKHVKIIAKIENYEGISNVPGILRVADGIMVARGDMGVSVPIFQIPVIQKTLIEQCNRRKKTAITATQMLESMTENPRPTRAEVTDVANAILDGSDCVMLSGETAAGLYPVETVHMMRQIIDFTQNSMTGKGRDLTYTLSSCAI